LKVFFIKGDTMTVNEVTVLGLGRTIVTFVFENALRLDLEMDAEVAVRVCGVKVGRESEA
jgi:hypothetical protein